MSTYPPVIAVDDDVMIATLLTRLIERAGFPSLPAAHSFEDFLLTLEREPVGIALLDVRVHGMVTLEGLWVVRRRYPELRVIAVTGYQDERFVHQAMQAGCEGMIWKGDHINAEIEEALGLVASDRDYLSPDIRPLVSFTRCTPRQPLTAAERALLRYLRRGLDDVTLAHLQGVDTDTINRQIVELSNHLGLPEDAQTIPWRLLEVRTT